MDEELTKRRPRTTLTRNQLPRSLEAATHARQFTARLRSRITIFGRRRAIGGVCWTRTAPGLDDRVGLYFRPVPHQIVKGWLDGKGNLHEKVSDAVWSGDRKPDPDTGKVPSVGSTVDVENAAWANLVHARRIARFAGQNSKNGRRPGQ